MTTDLQVIREYSRVQAIHLSSNVQNMRTTICTGNTTLEKELLRKEQKIENLNKETQNNWNSNDNDGFVINFNKSVYLTKK